MYEGLELHELKSVYEMMSLKGKKALITGAAGGIGRSCALALAEVGADIALMDTPVKADVLKEYAAYIRGKFGRNVAVITGDVCRETSVSHIYETVEKELGTIDVLFSNAGILCPTDGADIPLEDFKKMLDVNLTGMLLMNRGAANMMKKHGHGGSIINTASMSGFVVNRTNVDGVANICYPATKAAVTQLTKALAINYAQDGIRVNSISPGYVFSGLHVKSDPQKIEFFKSTVPLKRFGTLNEVVGSVVYLASDLSSYCMGTNLVFDGGYSIW